LGELALALIFRIWQRVLPTPQCNPLYRKALPLYRLNLAPDEAVADSRVLVDEIRDLQDPVLFVFDQA